MPKQAFTLTLPRWLDAFLHSKDTHYPSIEDRTRLCIDLARKNVLEKTGGPFGAAIFEKNTGELISVGVNRVVPLGISMAHAEMMAISFAQQKLGTYSLRADGQHGYDLATSAQMCSMCLGGVLWAGVNRVICGATSQDVEEVSGFDEGPIHPDWIQELNARGIEVHLEVLREEARDVLRFYRRTNGEVYNG